MNENKNTNKNKGLKITDFSLTLIKFFVSKSLII